MKIEQLPIAAIQPYAGNAKLHTAKQVEQIAASIQRFGFNDPIAIDDDGIIIEGHGRLLAAEKLGLKTIPVIRLVGLTEAQKTAYRIAHNKLTINTEFDFDLLKSEFIKLEEIAADLMLTGFDEGEIKTLLRGDSGIEYDESIAAGIELCECPNCGHEHVKNKR